MSAFERWRNASELPDVWAQQRPMSPDEHVGLSLHVADTRQTTNPSLPQNAAPILQDEHVGLSLHITDARQTITPNPPRNAASISRDEPVGLALHGTELKDFAKPVPQRLKDRFFDIKILYSQPLYDSISKRNKDPGNISMKLRYLGLDSQNTELHIVIQCEKRVAKKVKKFFAQKHVEEELLPDFRVLVLGKPPIEVANDEMIDVLTDSLPVNTICGMPITLSGNGRSVRCTIGGVIVVETDQKRLYGLTAGHPLRRIRVVPSDKKLMNEVYGSSSSSDEEEYSESDDASTETSLSLPKSEHSDTERTCDDNLLQTKPPIGTVVYDSFINSPEENYDWALLDLNEEYALPNLVNRGKQPKDSDIEDDKPEVHRYYIDSIDTTLTKQVLVLKQDKPRMAELSLNTSSLMMSPGSKFVNAHDVTFKDGSPLCPGDSGIWVVDAKTLGLYGHVVSVDAFGEAQVMPIQSTLKSIKRQLEATRVSLATSSTIDQPKLSLSGPYTSNPPGPTAQFHDVSGDTIRVAKSPQDTDLDVVMPPGRVSRGENRPETINYYGNVLQVHSKPSYVQRADKLSATQRRSDAFP